MVVTVMITKMVRKGEGTIYGPKGALGGGEAGAEEELGDLGDEAFGVLGAVAAEDVLGDGGVADDDEVAGPGGEAVDGAVLEHPLEEWEEEGAAQEVGDVLQLGIGHGDAGIVLGSEGSGEGGEPVRAHPRARAAAGLGLGLGRGIAEGRGRDKGKGFSSEEEVVVGRALG